MNRYMKIIVTALLLLIASAGMAENTASIDPETRAVAETYFDALRAGDQQTLLSLFADKERAKNEDQLRDPAYSWFLMDRYRNARLEITGGGTYSGIPFVDITIWLNDVETIRERLILRPSTDPFAPPLQIVGRKELSN